MNRILYFLLASLITYPAAQAIDIKTDAYYKKLVAAITQAHTVEKFTTAWQKITASATVTTQDQQEIVTQTLQLAQGQKTALEQELSNLGDTTKNHSKITWGAAQLALGTWLVVGEVYIFQALYTHIHPSKIPGCDFIWPERWLMNKDLISRNTCNFFALSRFLALNPILGGYCIYKAYHNLSQGLNYKQVLQNKITNLDAIIAYTQTLQLNNQ